ncbi:DUF58 domain-containing protein, partial [Rubrobacter calidifluminis]|uniref:DUF58 domain-containing protein n=1 Tax=Rubrobacter calidifluminis TaxID=1392640 RepID=UPI002360B356
MPAGRERARPSVRPTARGWQALVAGGTVLGLAVTFGTTQLFQLAYALLAVLLAGLLTGLWGGASLRYLRALPAGGSFVAGRTARVGLLVEGGRKAWYRVVEVRDLLPERKVFRWENGDGGRLEVDVTFGRRGIYRLGPAEVVSEDLFGMLRFSWRFTAGGEVVVYPRTWEVPGVLLEGDDGGGPAHPRRTSPGGEFTGLREYRAGDDLRHVSWKSLAKTGELYVREFSELVPARYTVALDLQRRGLRAPEREVEDAISTAASVAAALHAMGSPFRLLCNDGRASRTGFGTPYEGHMRLLAGVVADGSKPLSSFLASGEREPGDGVIVVSRGGDDGLAACVGRLRASGIYVAVIVLAGYGCPRSGGVRAMRHEEGVEGRVAELEAAGARVFLLRREEGGVGLVGT